MKTCRHAMPMIAVAALLGLLALPAHARNVDLATVPPRRSVQLTIYNSDDLTLVRETRNLSLKKGVNRIQYSWAGTLIDPTSVEIRPLDHEAEIEVLDTTFPGDKPQQLVWNIDSKFEGQAGFQVTYFTSGLSWSADYMLVANPAETDMSFDSYVQVYNNSGEEYEDAQVRLVVGVVNLVQRIQDLARGGVPVGVPGAPRPAGDSLRRMALKGAIDGAELAMAERPAEIVKEGLSEYFIYTIEGAQTIRNGWSRRMISFSARQVKFDVLYRVRPHQYGERPVRFFILKNDQEHKLGTTPLPDGLVRSFRDNGRDGLEFLGQQPVNYVPIKAEIELNLGTDDEVVWERKPMDARRLNFVFQTTGNNTFVTGWDETSSWNEEVRNYRDKAVRMEMRHVFDGDVEIEAEAGTMHDYHTVQFVFDVAAHEKLPWRYQTIQHNGSKEKQNAARIRGR